MRGDICEHHAASANFCAFTDCDVAQHGGACCDQDAGLYFCGPESVQICSLLQQVFKSLKVSRRFEYARFDDFGAVFVGIKVEVHSDEFPVVASALRLSGMEISSL